MELSELFKHKKTSTPKIEVRTGSKTGILMFF